jgi:hypothetical protein
MKVNERNAASVTKKRPIRSPNENVPRVSIGISPSGRTYFVAKLAITPW